MTPNVLTRRELDRSLITGVAWTGGLRTVTQALQWLAALIVVRLLAPTDYGIVGMAMAYIALVRLTNEFGLSAAVIQHHHLTRSQIARLAGVSGLFGVILAGISMAGATAVARFFDEPRVEAVVAVLSLTLLCGGFEAVPRSLLKRERRFRSLAYLHSLEGVTYAATTIGLAFVGWGYWALVAGAVVGAFTRAVAANFWHPHPIAWPGDLASIRQELVFGWHVIVSRFALYVRRFADVVVVGRLLGTAALGIYSVAWNQANVIVERLTDVASDVTPSVLASTQYNKAELRRYLRIFTRSVAVLSFPLTIGLALVADDFVLLAFGERWAPTILPLRIFAVAALARSITPYLSQVLIATDRTRQNMRFAIVAALGMSGLFVVGSAWGASGVACAWLIGHPLVAGPTVLRDALKAVGMSVREYLAALRPAAVATAAMAAAVMLVRHTIPMNWPAAARLGVQVTVGALVYALAVAGPYRREFGAVRSVLRKHDGEKSRDNVFP